MKDRSQSWIGGHPKAGRTPWQLAIPLLLLPVRLLAQDLPNLSPGEAIVHRVSETYRNARSYQFAGTLRRTWMVGFEPRVAEMYFQAASSGDGRYKLQSGLGMSKILAVSDGGKISIYSAEDGKYAERESGDLAGSIRGGLGDREASLLFAAWNIASRYQSLPRRTLQVEVAGNEVVPTGSGEVECLVLRLRLRAVDPSPAAAVWFTTLWIDPARWVVLRERSSSTPGDEEVAIRQESEERVAFTAVRVNDVLPDSLFRFAPPAAAQLVHRIPSWPDWFSQEEGRLGRAFEIGPPDFGSRDFSLVSTEGVRHDTKQLRGRILLLDFTATWCAPCLKQLEVLRGIHRDYSARGVVVLGIGTESRDVLHRSWKARRSPYPVLVDSGGTASALFNISALPTLVIIDRQGAIQSSFSGLVDRELVEKALAGLGVDER
jgi:peroxiredoxin